MMRWYNYWENISRIKNDVFSLGVTMLECMSLKNGGEFYSF